MSAFRSRKRVSEPLRLTWQLRCKTSVLIQIPFLRHRWNQSSSSNEKFESWKFQSVLVSTHHPLSGMVSSLPTLVSVVHRNSESEKHLNEISESEREGFMWPSTRQFPAIRQTAMMPPSTNMAVCQPDFGSAYLSTSGNTTPPRALPIIEVPLGRPQLLWTPWAITDCATVTRIADERPATTPIIIMNNRYARRCAATKNKPL